LSSNRRESISRPHPSAPLEPDPANRPNKPRFSGSEVVLVGREPKLSLTDVVGAGKRGVIGGG